MRAKDALGNTSAAKTVSWYLDTAIVTPLVTSGPASLSSSTSASFTFGSPDSDVTFSCSIDGGLYGACTSPKSYTGLTNNKTHTFAVKATDTAGNSATSATYAWKIQTSPPVTLAWSDPAGLPASVSSSASATLAFTTTGATTVACSLDAGSPSACTSPATPTGLSDGPHSFTVTASNATATATLTFSWFVDTSAPAAPQVTGPTGYVTTPDATIDVLQSEPGDSLTCQLDGVTVNCTTTVTANGLPDGNHTFTAVEADKAGNTSQTTLSWTVDTIAPAAPGVVGPNGLVATADATIDVTPSDAADSVSCDFDGAVIDCSSTVSLAGLADGDHVFTATESDLAGNTSQTTLTWTVDTTAPMPPIVTGPTGTVTTSDATIDVAAAETGDTVECILDDQIVDCSVTLVLTGLGEGVHTLVATETDAAGNFSQFTLTWTVDTTAPSATYTDPALLTGQVGVTFSEDVGGVDATSVTLTDDQGAAIASSMSCADASDTTVDCASGGVRSVTFTPAVPYLPGQNYVASVNPPGATSSVADAVGNVAAPDTHGFRGQLLQDQTSSAASGFTWRLVKSKKAQGGSYLVEHRKGATATWTFSGKTLTWVTRTGPDQGTATVYVDGVKKATVNNYTTTTKYGVKRVFKGLPSGSHTVKIVASGKKGNKKGKGTFVTIDAFKVGTKLTATPALTTAWSRVTNKISTNGSYVVADLKGQSVSFTFRGTGVDCLILAGPAMGKASVYVDGVKKTTLDTYSRAVQTTKVSVRGLADTQHTVKLVVLGVKRAAASGTSVALDGWKVY